MNEFDNKCIEMALSEARKSLEADNYPVGTALRFDNEIIGSSGNYGETTKNYVNHAETKLIIENADKMLKAFKEKRKITLYSTLEPCLMCLGMAVMNKVDRIVYLQKDPHAGACGIDVSNLGIRYKNWPTIEIIQYSSESKNLLIAFFNSNIVKGNHVEWNQMMSSLFR